MSSFKAYNDAAARHMVIRFRERLAPLMAEVAPDWLLHHIELRRDYDRDHRDQVEIRLVIKPIGDARELRAPRELSAGPALLQHGQPEQTR